MSAVAKGKVRAGSVDIGPINNTAFKVFGSDAPNTPNGITNTGHVDHSVGPTQYTGEAYPSLKRIEYENGDTTPNYTVGTGTGINRTTKIQEAVQVLDTWNMTYLMDSPPPPTLSASATSTEVTVTIDLHQKEAGFLDVYLPRVDSLFIDLVEYSTNVAEDDFFNGFSNGNTTSLTVETSISGAKRNNSNIIFTASQISDSSIANTGPAFAGGSASAFPNYGIVYMNSPSTTRFSAAQKWWLRVYYTNKGADTRSPQYQYQLLELSASQPPLAVTGITTNSSSANEINISSYVDDNGTQVQDVTYFLVPDVTYGSNSTGSYRYRSSDRTLAYKEHEGFFVNYGTITASTSISDAFTINLNGVTGNLSGRFVSIIPQYTDLGFFEATVEGQTNVPNESFQLYEIVSQVSGSDYFIKRVGVKGPNDLHIFVQSLGVTPTGTNIIEVLQRSVSNSSSTGTFTLTGNLSGLNWLTRYRFEARATNILGSVGPFSGPPPTQGTVVTEAPAATPAIISSSTSFPFPIDQVYSTGAYYIVNIDGTGAATGSTAVALNSSQKMFVPTTANYTSTSTDSASYRLNEYAGAFTSFAQPDAVLVLDFKVTDNDNSVIRSRIKGTYYAFDAQDSQFNPEKSTADMVSSNRYGGASTADLFDIVIHSQDSYDNTTANKGVWLKETQLQTRINASAILDASATAAELRNNHSVECDIIKYDITNTAAGLNYNPHMTNTTSTQNKFLTHLYFSNSIIRVNGTGSEAPAVTVANINASSANTEKISGIESVTGTFNITTNLTVSNLFGNFYSSEQHSELVYVSFLTSESNHPDDYVLTTNISFSDLQNSLTAATYNGGKNSWTSDNYQFVQTGVSFGSYSHGLTSNFLAKKFDGTNVSETSPKNLTTNRIFDAQSSTIKSNTTEPPPAGGGAFSANQKQKGTHVNYYSGTTAYASPVLNTSTGNPTSLFNMPSPDALRNDLNPGANGSTIYDHNVALTAVHNLDAQLAEGRFHPVRSGVAYRNYSGTDGNGSLNYASISSRRYHTRVYRPNNSAGIANTTITFTLENCRQTGNSVTVDNLGSFIKAYYYVYTDGIATQTTGWMSLQGDFSIGKFSIGSTFSSGTYPYGQTLIENGRIDNTTIGGNMTAGNGQIVYSAQGKSKVYRASQDTVVVLLLELEETSDPISFVDITCGLA